MFPFGWYLLGLLIFVAAILLEAWRQSRQIRRAGGEPKGRGSLIGAGVLELQALLQPDRKVEEMLAQSHDPERVNPAHRPETPGDGIRAGD